jgi:hypothetical protein
MIAITGLIVDDIDDANRVRAKRVLRGGVRIPAGIRDRG